MEELTLRGYEYVRARVLDWFAEVGRVALLMLETIDWLKARADHYDTAMLYLSDHGESLGEFGLVLHGMPYSVAPEAQKHVPWVMWFSEGMRSRDKLSLRCLEGELDKPITHDNLYHTVLGAMDVQTPSYRAPLDALASCRGQARYAG